MDAELCPILRLPNEILLRILKLPVLTFVDLCNLSATCSSFNEILSDENLWREKFKQKWPYCFQVYQKKSIIPSHWKEEFKERFSIQVKFRAIIEALSRSALADDELSDETILLYSNVSDHPFLRIFTLDEVLSILQDGKKYENLTMKFYGQKFARLLRHELLEPQWKEFLSKENPPLEIGVWLICQWFQPSLQVTLEWLLEELESLAMEVKREILIQHPNHPLITHPDRLAHWLEEGWKENINAWGFNDCYKILQCQNIVLYKYHKFHIRKEEDDSIYDASVCYDSPPSLENVLLRYTHHPITLPIIYSSIARRLGIHCTHLNLPGILVFKHPSLGTSWLCIDVFEQGNLLEHHDCEQLVPGLYSPVGNFMKENQTPQKIFERVCWVIADLGRQQDSIGSGLISLRNALELLMILNPNDLEHRLMLSRVYLQLRINLDKVIALLQEVSDQDPASSHIVSYMVNNANSVKAEQNIKAQKRVVKPKLRVDNPEVEFAVGMIMHHKKYDYRCIITGWDAECAASQDWMNQMGVFRLSSKNKQPFYNVLVDDNTVRYAAQENLEPSLNLEPLSHYEIGKYFERYDGKRYVPNFKKMVEYPQDYPYPPLPK